MGKKDLNINNLDDEVRIGLERMQKDRGFSTLTGLLKVLLKECVDEHEKKKVDKKRAFSENRE